jgi:two-component system, OmpR family, response regulator MprA
MGSLTILLIDDDRSGCSALSRELTCQGYDVRDTEIGQDRLAQVAETAPDAVVLDVGKQDKDGLEICRRLRNSGNRVPILILTARHSVSDHIAVLDAGADDFLVRPFDMDELAARLRALLRRAGGSQEPASISFEELRLESARHGVGVEDAFVELTRTEYRLLELLMRNPRRILPHSLIYERVWGYDLGPTSNALRVYIGYLRRKLEAAGSRHLIQTVHGVGYVLREPHPVRLIVRPSRRA